MPSWSSPITRVRPIIRSPPCPAWPNAPSWSVTSRVCSNLLTSLNYRFLWANVGTHDNPQPKIVAARVEWGAEDVAHVVEVGWIYLIYLACRD